MMFDGQRWTKSRKVVTLPMKEHGDGIHVMFGRVCHPKDEGAVATEWTYQNQLKSPVYAIPVKCKGHELTNLMYGLDGYAYLAYDGHVYVRKGQKMNITLLKKLRTRFARMKHPQHFRMEQIAVKNECGAAMCFIGHTLELAGYKRRVSHDLSFGSLTDASRCDYDFISPLDGEVVIDLTGEARELLGLSYDQGNKMFHAFHLKTPKDAVNFIDKIIETNGDSLIPRW